MRISQAKRANRDKGKVVNIEPSIGAAFVAFGGRVNGFLHVSDVLPAYGRDDFRLEDVIEGRARVDVDDGPESMQQALSDDDDDDDDVSAEKPKRPRRKASAKDAEADSSDAATDEATAADDADDLVEEAVDAEPQGEAVNAIEVALLAGEQGLQGALADGGFPADQRTNCGHKNQRHQ